MREILVYDAKRVPSEWTGLIRPSQYAVFLSDVESSASMSSDGSVVSSASKHSCLLFESLPEAEAYCGEAVQRIPRVRCDVFDSAGRVNAPVVVFVNQKFAHTLDTEAGAQRLIRWGFIAIALSVPLFWYAWKKSAASEVWWWWPILLGINVLFAGLRLLHWGYGLKDEIRYQKEQAALRLQQNAAKKDS
jgi:hypothetical protein